MRILNNREELGLTWDDVSGVIARNTGKTISGDAWRKKYKRLCALDNPEFTEEQDFLRVAAERAKQERQQVNAIYRRVDREQTIKDIALEVANSLNSRIPFNLTNTKDLVKKRDDKAEAVLLLSDWHYGIICKDKNTYNTWIAVERVETLLKETIKFINENKVSTLYILNLGDMIAGKIHAQLRINSQIDTITQVIQVSEVLATFIHNLCTNCKNCQFEYHSVIDNHSRIDQNKEEAMQLESLSRIIDWHIETRLGDIHKNLKMFPSEGNTIGNFTTKNGVNIAFVHGDKDKQKNIIESLNTFCGQHLDLIFSAHLHHFSMDENGRTTHISNGSLMGTDEYAYNLRLDSHPSQTIILLDDTYKDIDILKKIKFD